MTLTPESIKRINTNEANNMDEDNLFGVILNSWEDRVALQNRIDIAVAKKRQSGSETYQKPEDDDEIDNAIYDSIIEEIADRCKDVGVDSNEISDQLMQDLVTYSGIAY